MANPWFRMYSEFANDPKVQMLSEAMQRRLIMLFCLRCSDVTVTASDEEIAFQLRISDAELQETKAVFIAKGFVTKTWEIKNWDKRQFASDSSAERTRAYRAKKRDVTETSQHQKSDAIDTEQNRTDTEQIVTAKPVSRKTRMPDGFEISERVKTWAAEKGFTRLNEHLESFVSKAKAAGYKYVDWDEALMNAIRDNWAKLTPIGATPGVRPLANDWMRDDNALMRKAAEIGINPRPGEQYQELRQRVAARMQ